MHYVAVITHIVADKAAMTKIAVICRRVQRFAIKIIGVLN